MAHNFFVGMYGPWSFKTWEPQHLLPLTSVIIKGSLGKGWRWHERHPHLSMPLPSSKLWKTGRHQLFGRRTLRPQRIFLFVVPKLLPSLSWNYHHFMPFYLRMKAQIFICIFCSLNVENKKVHLHSFLSGSIIIQQISGSHWNLELNCREPEGSQAAVFPWAVFLYKHLIVTKSDVQYVKTWIWCK